MIKITKANIKKFNNSPKNDPQRRFIGPKDKTASLQEMPESKGSIKGIKISFTKDFTKVLEAAPITKAIAKLITLYSFKKSKKSLLIRIVLYFYVTSTIIYKNKFANPRKTIKPKTSVAVVINIVAEVAGSLPIFFINKGTIVPKKPATKRLTTMANARITAIL